MGHLGAMLGHLGAMLSYLGVMLGDLGAMLGHLGPMLGHLGAILGHLGAMLGLCWAILGLILGHLGARLGQGGTPPSSFFPFMLFLSKSKKHRKLRGFSGADHWSAVGARSRIAKASGLRPGALPIDRACWPDLSAYARQPARGPTMLAHLVAICWPMLAYVGRSCRQRGPILWLCWPMFASCWPMLSQKSRKMGTAKKHCKTQDILMFGGLSWGYVGPSWGYVGLS